MHLGQLCNQLLCNQLQGVASRWPWGGGEGGGGIVQFIFTIRKQHSVIKVHTL